MENVDSILCDFGASNVRFACLTESAAVKNIEPYVVAEWESLSLALSNYAEKNKINLAGKQLYLTHTGHVEDGGLALDYKHTKPWSFKFADVEKHLGLKKIISLNDLVAAAHAPLWQSASLFKPVRTGNPTQGLDCAIIGIGTGCGHAFLNRVTNTVKETYGGHIPLLAVTPLQRAIAEQSTMIFEDVLSGRGIYNLYKILHKIADTTPTAVDNAGIVAIAKTDETARKAMALFCEFLGLYAHMLCSATFAYGGVYLGGGVIDRMDKAGLFDATAFMAQFNQNMVPVVAKSLEATPIWLATTEYINLYGLAAYAHRNKP